MQENYFKYSGVCTTLETTMMHQINEQVGLMLQSAHFFPNDTDTPTVGDMSLPVKRSLGDLSTLMHLSCNGTIKHGK